MQTIRNQYDKKLTYQNLMKAHKLSKRGKGYRKEVIQFNLKQEEYIMWLYEQLENMTYKHSGYSVFYVTEPKLRKIEKSKYIDRIVHRWVVDYFLEPYFVPRMIHTSYACLKGKGMHKACLEVQKAMKHCNRTWGEYYMLKMDVAKYFQSIDRKILMEILERKIKDPKLLDLINKIVYSDNEEKGLPIGNYTSQTFANIYLNEVDKYIKYELRCKYYFRYMDDSLVIVKTKQEAAEILEKIKKFLDEKLKLSLNSKTQIIKSKQGVNFCGYKINENRLKIRDRGKRNLKDKIKTLEKRIKDGEMSSTEAYKHITGHVGYIQIANVKNLTNKLFYCGKL